MTSERRLTLKPLTLVAFPLFIVGGLIVVWIFRSQIYNVFASPTRIRDWVNQWGYVAPLVFIGLQFTQVVLFVIPGEVAQAAGGYIFGVWFGILYSVVGILLGSVFNFFLARLLGVPFVEGVFGKERLRRFDAVLTSRRATVAFFVLFLIPGIPKDALCYVAGLSTVSFPAFFLISTAGRLPGIIGSAALGGAAAAKSWIVFGSILLVALVLFVIGLIYRDPLQTWVERVLLKRPQKEDRSGE
ncbi:MAG TPA: TVP38/TMEM64 family protein [Spirochaetia bacterium]|nr:TVP38/TMEM64 family protein [Spirochaetia bacterium]